MTQTEKISCLIIKYIDLEYDLKKISEKTENNSDMFHITSALTSLERSKNFAIKSLSLLGE